MLHTWQGKPDIARCATTWTPDDIWKKHVNEERVNNE